MGVNEKIERERVSLATWIFFGEIRLKAVEIEAANVKAIKKAKAKAKVDAKALELIEKKVEQER